MSDISIPGVSSKYKTTEIVNKLVDAQRIRLTKLEDNVSSLEEKKSVWRTVNRDFTSFQRVAKSLYGFENPFSEKIANSSNEKILTAVAARNTPTGEYPVTVKQIASSDRFLSRSLDRSFRVQKGTYTLQIGKESLSMKYNGGTIEDFARRLSRKGKDLVQATVVRDTAKTQVLMIEAIPTGAENRLLFKDSARALSVETGMMQTEGQKTPKISMEKLAENARTRSGEPLPEEAVSFSKGTMTVAPGASLQLPFDKPIQIQDGMVLEYKYRTIEYSDQDLSPPLPPGAIWPDVPEGTYKGITVHSIPNSVGLPGNLERTPPERVDNWNVLSVEGTPNSLPLPPIRAGDNFQTVRVNQSNLPSEIQALSIENSNSHRAVEITGVQVLNLNDHGGLRPSNAIGRAEDAVLEYRGIEIKRPNNSIDDLIDGLTLNLKKASDEEVNLDVEPDTQTAKERIISFVFNYNQLLTRILVLTNDNPAVIDNLDYLDDDQKEDYRKQLGTMRGDSLLIRSRNRLRSIVSNPHKTRDGSELSLLSQIGISTNASTGGVSGGTVDRSRLQGYLEIDEDMLDSILASDTDAVKDLFGSDTDGDLVIESGVAPAIDNYISAYTGSRGTIRTRVTRLDTQIKGVNEDIADYKDYLSDYEADLKRKYGKMESTLNALESSSKELDNFSNPTGSGR